MAFFFFFDKLTEIENLQKQIEQHGKIAPDVLRKINYKFRLEWNYHSNSMEGNTLTIEETRGIMTNNITVHGKPIKDVMEMKGHDDVINTILKIGKSELNISERRIKEIHKGIMHEDNPDKQILLGQWKTAANCITNFKGEEYTFTAPEDVPDAMHKLTDWLAAEKDKIKYKLKDALHPIQIAFKFHIDFVTIHPFFDGNGRTARILSNLILISYGYPPLYIKKEEENSYHQYLGEIQMYGADTELFFDFMGGLLIRSQQLVLDAIEGRDIDEPNDWQKKLQLLKIERSEDDVTITKNDDSVVETVRNSIEPFLQKLIFSLKTFDDLFSKKKVSIKTQNKAPYEIEEDRPLSWAIKYFLKSAKHNDTLEGILEEYNPIEELSFNYSLMGFKRNGLNTFGIYLDLKWSFRTYQYSLSIEQNSEHTVEKLYHESYTHNEIDSIINKIGNQLLREIERRIINK